MAEEEHHRFLDEVEFEEDWEEWDPSKGSFLKHTIAGSMAGVVEHVGMFPVDTYKVCCANCLLSPPRFSLGVFRHSYKPVPVTRTFPSGLW